MAEQKLRFLDNPTPMEKLIGFGAGTLAGILVNDGIEKLQGGVWSTELFRFPTPSGSTVGVGLDDLVQMAFGFLVAVAAPKNPYIGYGVVAGTILTKVGEIFGTKIKVFKGTTPQVFSKEGGISSSSVEGMQNNYYLNNSLGYGHGSMSERGNSNSIPVNLSVNEYNTYSNV